MIRGAFEFQGQKCSAASRAYVARSVWTQMRDDFLAEVEALTMGDVTDFSNFMGAVIDDRAFAKHKAAIARAKRHKDLDLLAGGEVDDSVGYFVRPTVIVSPPTRPTRCSRPSTSARSWRARLRGRRLREGRAQMESFAPYALTGAVIAQDRTAIAWAQRELRFAAGNFYINDKPTGAVVGQQPFGGGRASGTNDKAGARSTCCAGPAPAASRRRSCHGLSPRASTRVRRRGRVVRVALGAAAVERAGSAR